jgi:hypothetical protein
MARYERLGNLSSQKLGSFEPFSGLGTYQKRERDPKYGITVVYDCHRTKQDPNRPGYLINAADNDTSAQESCSMTADSQRAQREAAAGGGAGASAAAPAPAAGDSVAGVLTGVGAILGPLANAFATGYSANLQVDFQKSQMRNRSGYQGPPMPIMLPPPPRKANTGLIIGGVVVGLIVIGGIVVVAS